MELLGRCYTAMGDHEKAREILESDKDAPKAVAALKTLAKRHQSKGRYDLAERNYLAFILKAPEEQKPGGYLDLATNYHLAGKHRQAADALDVLLKKYPTSDSAGAARKQIANLRASAEKHAECSRVLELAPEKSPDYADHGAAETTIVQPPSPITLSVVTVEPASPCSPEPVKAPRKAPVAKAPKPRPVAKVRRAPEAIEAIPAPVFSKPAKPVKRPVAVAKTPKPKPVKTVKVAPKAVVVKTPKPVKRPVVVVKTPKPKPVKTVKAAPKAAVVKAPKPVKRPVVVAKTPKPKPVKTVKVAPKAAVVKAPKPVKRPVVVAKTPKPKPTKTVKPPRAAQCSAVVSRIPEPLPVAMVSHRPVVAIDVTPRLVVPKITAPVKRAAAIKVSEARLAVTIPSGLSAPSKTAPKAAVSAPKAPKPVKKPAAVSKAPKPVKKPAAVAKVSKPAKRPTVAPAPRKPKSSPKQQAKSSPKQQAQYDKGMALLDKGDLKLAAAELLKVDSLSGDPKLSAKGLCRAGLIFEKLRDTETAIKTYRTCVKKYRGVPSARLAGARLKAIE